MSCIRITETKTRFSLNFGGGGGLTTESAMKKHSEQNCCCFFLSTTKSGFSFFSLLLFVPFPNSSSLFPPFFLSQHSN